MNIDIRLLEQKLATYPTPIALGCGRICRARTVQDRLDAVMKCAELITRYLAAVSICSYATRAVNDEHVSINLTDISGNLSLGNFLTIVQAVANADVEHPLRPNLVAAFKAQPNETESAGVGLIHLLELRNRLGHDLTGMSEAKAVSILQEDNPDGYLMSSLQSIDAILGLPLFLVEDVRVMGRSNLLARRLLLMGESSDPIPEEIEINQGFEHQRYVYLGVADGVVSLFPFLTWELVNAKANYGLYFVNGFKNSKLSLITAYDDYCELNDNHFTEARNLLAAKTIPLETVELASGRTFLSHWSEAKKSLEQASKLSGGPIPWEDLDLATLSWYGAQLGAFTQEETQEKILECLFDGRDWLKSNEINQVKLLFGSDQTVRQLIGRDMIDCRLRKSTDTRWDERIESSANVLGCLRSAIEFFGRHIGVDGITLDGLSVVSGTADYIAMREGLVNLFIHQDFTDASTVSQIEISQDRAVFFNAGKSLVSQTSLVNGGKSQCRNPVIGRALRLISFAELAGSGLRELHNAWRFAKRRPPVFESNTSANTFTITLDWREIPDTSDTFWKEKLGLTLTGDESLALSLSLDLEGVTVDQVASALGIFLEDATDVVRNLSRQSLVDEETSKFYIKPYLRALVEESRKSH